MLPNNNGMNMMRYGSFGLPVDDMARAGSSSGGTPGPMTQQDIDNLLAMSRAQAGNQRRRQRLPLHVLRQGLHGQARAQHLATPSAGQAQHPLQRTAAPHALGRRRQPPQERRGAPRAHAREQAQVGAQEASPGEAGRAGRKSGASNTPNPDDSDADEGDDGDADDGVDADVSNMSMSFAANDADESLSAPPDAQLFASHEPLGRPAKRQRWRPRPRTMSPVPVGRAPHAGQLLAGPFGAHELPAGSGMYSHSPLRRTGPSLGLPTAQHVLPAMPVAAGPNDSFSSNSSDYSQPNSASFFNDSFGGSASNAGSDGASTSIDTPATTWPALPALPAVEGDKLAGAAPPKMQKGETRDAAIQLLALRSGTNSPTDEREVSLRRRDDEAWSSTPSRAKVSEHEALTALSAGRADEAASPSPVSRTLPQRGMPVTTPGPARGRVKIRSVWTSTRSRRIAG